MIRVAGQFDLVGGAAVCARVVTGWIRRAAERHPQPKDGFWHLRQQLLQDKARSQEERPRPSKDGHHNPALRRPGQPVGGGSPEFTIRTILESQVRRICRRLHHSVHPLLVVFVVLNLGLENLVKAL